MNEESLEQTEANAIEKLQNDFFIKDQKLEEVKAFASCIGHYITGYDLQQEAFILSDGELYTLQAIRSCSKRT